MKNEIKAILSTITLATLLLSSCATVVATGGPTVCIGILPPGTYQSIVVPAGQTCLLGVISIIGPLIGPVTVNGGVQVGPGATFLLGYDGGPPTGTINGGIAADHPAQVQVHDAHINGGVTVEGGAGPFASGCAFPFGVCATVIEGNSINGAVTINGYNGFFLGFIRNHVSGTVTISNIVVPDEIDLGSNVVHGSLVCFGNTPTENTGGSPGPTPNRVTGQDTCHEV